MIPVHSTSSAPSTSVSRPLFQTHHTHEFQHDARRYRWSLGRRNYHREWFESYRSKG
jgi:hypothetical protein